MFRCVAECFYVNSHLNVFWDGIVEEDRGERIRLVYHYESTVYFYDIYSHRHKL